MRWNIVKLAIGSGIVGLLTLAASIASVFSPPWDMYAYGIVFLTIILVVADVAMGGLLD